MIKDVIHFKGEIDLKDFCEVPYPIKKNPLAVNISESGFVTINDKFLSLLNTNSLVFKISKDKRLILIDENGEPNYRFNKDGSKKDIEFSRSLYKSGLSLPARYEMEYYDKENCWIGKYIESQKSELQKNLKTQLSKKK